MDIQTIINNYYASMDEKEKSRTIGWLKRTEALIGDQDIKSALSDKEILCKLFATSSGTAVLGTQYIRTKKYIKNLLDYYGVSESVIPSLEEVQDANGVVEDLFGDLDSIFALIDSVGERKCENYQAVTGFVRMKSIVILAWYGLSLDQIGDFKKEDIVVFGENKLYIRVGNNLIQISPKEYCILSLQAENDYIVSPSGRRDYYIEDSEFLIRNKRGSQGADKKIFCNKIFQRFSQETFPNQINVKQVRYSGYFYRIWSDNSSETLAQKIEKHTGCTSDRTYMYMNLYNKWLQTFHPDGI